MPISAILIANRGEIAIRIARAAAGLSLRSVAVYSEDDAASLHVRMADDAIALQGKGVGAYLNIESIIRAAKDAGCDAIHPGYGFLAERADFAEACAAAGLTFIGPNVESLALFGDKGRARAAAIAADVPVMQGIDRAVTLEEAQAFFADMGPTIIKAVAGGGGRGTRAVLAANDVEAAFTRCQSEAKAAFGLEDVYVEQFIQRARHIEVQILGDQTGAITHLGERECSVQRRYQKVIEIAPAPGLDADLRADIIAAALRFAKSVGYTNLGTFEFLVDASGDAAAQPFVFIEANARLQVEHTVTEQVTGVDIVQSQIQLAGGSSLADIGLDDTTTTTPRGYAIQARINMETLAPDGTVKPTGGLLTAYEAPNGPGVRTDGFGYTGYTTSGLYDSLLAKVICHSPSPRFADAIARTARALSEFRLEGVATNIPFLQNVLANADFQSSSVHTRWVDETIDTLAAPADAPNRFAPNQSEPAGSRTAGARIDGTDPLAVLAYGQDQKGAHTDHSHTIEDAPDGMAPVRSPLQGTVVSVAVAVGDTVARGAELAVMEAMKMEHVVFAETAGVIRAVHTAPGDTLWENELLFAMEPIDDASETVAAEEEIDLDAIRPDLADVLARRALTVDENRPAAVARRRKTKQRTVRENVDDLVDPGTFIEYGPLVVAAQSQRRTFEDLLTRSPADGLVTGVGSINGDQFNAPECQAAVMAYDYTVFAGTQGVHNHWKTDRMIDVAERGRMPFVLFAEGGGGRPGDTDYGGFVGQNTFHHFGQLSGLVPMVGVVSGRCFAGNAALLACCDVIIATANANIGMGGPAMIEGGGLGVFTPEEIGPVSVQAPNGVIDIVVEDEAEAVATTKKYLSYFQGRSKTWATPDQRRLRGLIPENRLRVYEVRHVIETLADEGSVLELRQAFGKTMVTALARIDGRPIGVIANDPAHLGGAIDSDGSDKAARFMQLCDAFDIPLLYLCDTPGIMVGPEAESTALVRHSSRLYLTGCNLSVPYFTVVLRKAYGLGAIGMAAGNFRAPYFSVSWPTGEFGPMGLEGQVKLGYRAELAAIEDPEERLTYYEKMVQKSYEDGKATARSTTFAIDDTIDPAETRHWLAGMLSSVRPPIPRDGKKRPMIDAW